MKDSGFFFVYRSIRRHWVWNDPVYLRAWIFLLSEAAFEPKTVVICKQQINLQRGQLASTTRILNRELGLGSEATLNLLNTFADATMIDLTKTSKYTLITIINYDKYQSGEMEQSERKPKRKPKQAKEENKENKIIIPILSSLSREDEEKFLDKLSEERDFFENTAKSLAIEITSLDEEFGQFKAQILATEKIHNNYLDCRTHFYHWVKKRLENKAEPAPKKINLNGNESKHAARRSSDVPTKSDGEDDSTF